MAKAKLVKKIGELPKLLISIPCKYCSEINKLHAPELKNLNKKGYESRVHKCRNCRKELFITIAPNGDFTCIKIDNNHPKTDIKMNTQLQTIANENLNTFTALMAMNVAPGTPQEQMRAIVQQEIDYLNTICMTKPEIAKCQPESIAAGIKTVIRKNLSFDPDQGLVYCMTRNANAGTKDSPVWVTVLEVKESAEGKISVARQTGRILDIERPEIVYNEAQQVVKCIVRVQKPSFPRPRWEEVVYELPDFYRWRQYSHKDKSRNKSDADATTLNYANALYTSWQGGIDPEFCRAKAIKHTLKKMGTNGNEGRIIPGSQHERITENNADWEAASDDFSEYQDLTEQPQPQPQPMQPAQLVQQQPTAPIFNDDAPMQTNFAGYNPNPVNAYANAAPSFQPTAAPQQGNSASAQPLQPPTFNPNDL